MLSYEEIIGRITLSFLTYNLISYVNRIEIEPKTIGRVFKDLARVVQILRSSTGNLLGMEGEKLSNCQEV